MVRKSELNEVDSFTPSLIAWYVSDKKALKMMAAERETTIAAIIHEWVQEHLEEVEK